MLGDSFLASASVAAVAVVDGGVRLGGVDRWNSHCGQYLLLLLLLLRCYYCYYYDYYYLYRTLLHNSSSRWDNYPGLDRTL